MQSCFQTIELSVTITIYRPNSVKTIRTELIKMNWQLKSISLLIKRSSFKCNRQFIKHFSDLSCSYAQMVTMTDVYFFITLFYWASALSEDNPLLKWRNVTKWSTGNIYVALCLARAQSMSEKGLCIMKYSNNKKTSYCQSSITLSF